MLPSIQFINKYYLCVVFILIVVAHQMSESTAAHHTHQFPLHPPTPYTRRFDLSLMWHLQSRYLLPLIIPSEDLVRISRDEDGVDFEWTCVVFRQASSWYCRAAKSSTKSEFGPVLITIFSTQLSHVLICLSVSAILILLSIYSLHLTLLMWKWRLYTWGRVLVLSCDPTMIPSSTRKQRSKWSN